jgi:signal transduction histidine kinase
MCLKVVYRKWRLRFTFIRAKLCVAFVPFTQFTLGLVVDQQSILRQIASLETQLLSLRQSLVSLPADQRAQAAAGVHSVRAELAELEEMLSRAPAGLEPVREVRPGSRPELAAGAEDLVWSTERTTRLYAINTGLSVALTQAQAGRVVIEQALPALSAKAGVIMLSSDGTSLTTLDSVGASGAAIRPVPVSEPSPFGQAVRTAQPVWTETPEELQAFYAPSSDLPWRDAASLAVIPLIAEGRVLGVMAFRFDDARQFTFADRAFLLVLAQQCAAALERVHLYEQVRQAAALEERNRLARDLHDSVSQALYAIVLAVTAGRANLTKDLGRVARALDNIQALTGAAQADLRALLFDLKADSVARTGLVNALLERAQFLRLRHGLAVQTELCPEPSLQTSCKDALYGIAREALHNAAKHARANRVDLKLSQLAENLVLEIADDGVGFLPGEPRPGHYGLQSMRERAAELGAELRIDSTPGEGTRVVAVLPMAEHRLGGESMSSCVASGDS